MNIKINQVTKSPLSSSGLYLGQKDLRWTSVCQYYRQQGLNSNEKVNGTNESLKFSVF